MHAKMKKAVMLEFLFWTILGLAVLIPTAIFASQFLKFSDKALESFNKLAETIPTVRDGEIPPPVTLHMDKKSILAGFSKDSDKFEIHNYYPNNPNSDQIAYRFTRPKSENCPIQKACICLCKDAYQGLQDPLPESTECKDAKCISFNNINFLSERILEKYEDGGRKRTYQGGFLFIRSDDSISLEERLATRVLYIQRYKGVIDICIKSPCLTDDSKDNINFDAMLDLFMEFVQKYEECKSKQNGDCGLLSIRQQGNYYIYYLNSDDDRNGIYLMKGDFPGNFDDMRATIDKNNNQIFYQSFLYTTENKEIPTGNLQSFGNARAPELELSVKNSKVIISPKGTFDIELPLE
jgi:hypothetical protein